MAGKARRNTGGTVRKLASGRWQVRVRDTATGRLVSLGTFAAKADATARLRHAVAAQERGTWVPPNAGSETVSDFIAGWIATNQRITSPRTRERYEQILRTHIAPYFDGVRLRQVTSAAVRAWHSGLPDRLAPATKAKIYRTLRAALNTAVADGLIVHNPCRIESAGVDRSEERPIATVAEVQALADAAPERWRAMVLMAAWTSLRLGELAALERQDINLLKGTVSVTKNRQRLDGGRQVVLPPKSAAGRRTVALPPPLQPILETHMARWSAPGPDGLVFVGANGAPVDRSRWSDEWRRMREAIGRPDLRFHDLRHTGNMLAAATGATTKQLMARMGHSSMTAALRYQHATEDADQAIAEALGELMTPRGEVVDLDQRRSGP